MESYNGYQYNDCGVCVNPDIPYRFEKKDCSFEIEISETAQGWVYGYRYMGKIYGGGGGCSLNDPEKYPSRSKAIVASAEAIKRQFQNNREARPLPELDRIIAEESGKTPRFKEFTIFDYL